MNWTKGEWVAEGSCVECNGWPIASTWPDTRIHSDQSRGLMYSNALLIAAAPNLYEAGQAFFNPDGTYNLHPDNFKRLDEALNKAVGVVATSNEGGAEVKYCKVITSSGSCLTLNDMSRQNISQEEFDARMDHVCQSCPNYIEKEVQNGRSSNQGIHSPNRGKSTEGRKP